MTQALFDLSHLHELLDRLGGSSPIPLLVGVWPLRSHGMALRLHNEVPGISVPSDVLRRLAPPARTLRPSVSSWHAHSWTGRASSRPGSM